MTTMTRTTGSEGPRQDPYAYEEILISLPPKGLNKQIPATKVTVHLGLGETIEIRQGDNPPIKAWGYDRVSALFKQYVGTSLEHAQKAYMHVHYPTRCPNCGHNKTHYMSGFPGESFEVCDKCNHIVSSDFNEAAII